MSLNDTTNEIPYGYCQCGCGQKTQLAPQSSARKGWSKGEPMRYIAQHHMLAKRPTIEPNPSGLCACGCGQKTPIAMNSRTSRGWIKGKPKPFVAGHGTGMNLTPQQAFWAYVTPGGQDECWLWNGQIERNGYGRARYRGKRYSTHRLSWELHNGPIPKGLWVLHRCDNPSCVNPHHLFLGTSKDNTNDMTEKGRHAGRFEPGHPYYEKSR